MRLFFHLIAFSLLTFSIVNLSSCKEDAPCADIVCLNGGACLDGECICVTDYKGVYCEQEACDGVVCQGQGYCETGVCNCPNYLEGEFCETEKRTKYYGTYTASNNCTNGNTETYTVVIQIPQSDPTGFYINNFHNLEAAGVSPGDATMGANISTNGSEGLYISGPMPGASYYVNGTTTEIADGVFTLNYTITKQSNGVMESCSVTYVRQ